MHIYLSTAQISIFRFREHAYGQSNRANLQEFWLFIGSTLKLKPTQNQNKVRKKFLKRPKIGSGFSAIKFCEIIENHRNFIRKSYATNQNINDYTLIGNDHVLIDKINLYSQKTLTQHFPCGDRRSLVQVWTQSQFEAFSRSFLLPSTQTPRSSRFNLVSQVYPVGLWICLSSTEPLNTMTIALQWPPPQHDDPSKSQSKAKRNLLNCRDVYIRPLATAPDSRYHSRYD